MKLNLFKNFLGLLNDIENLIICFLDLCMICSGVGCCSSVRNSPQFANCINLLELVVCDFTYNITYRLILCAKILPNV